MTRALRVRVAAFLAAALAVLSLVLLAGSSTAFAVDAPQPPDRSLLTSENAGSVSVEQDGSRVTVSTDAERAYVFVYPTDADPVDVGWQEPVDGAFGIDLSLMPSGEVAVALLDAEGELLGWAGTELSEEHSHAPPLESSADATPERVAAPVWLWVAGAGGLILVLAVIAVFAVRRRRKPDRAHSA